MPKTMGKRLRKLKKIRLHHEGKATLLWSAILLIVLNFVILHIFDSRLPFDICIAVSAVLYAVLLNFFQCPIRTFEGETGDLSWRLPTARWSWWKRHQRTSTSTTAASW